MIVSSLAIFNYEKQHSGVVTGTMYALRTNPHARELLGDEVTFAHGVPWIRGEINQVQGRVDIGLWVKGSRQTAWMRFRSRRWKRMGTVRHFLPCRECCRYVESTELIRSG